MSPHGAGMHGGNSLRNSSSVNAPAVGSRSISSRKNTLFRTIFNALIFAKGILFIEQSRNHKDRLVPVGSVALGWVRHYLDAVRPMAIHDQDHPFVFIGHKTGEPLFREGLVWAVRQTFMHSGIRSLPLSAMRSSAATNMLDAGMNVVHTARLLGHDNLRTTQRYLHTEECTPAAVLQRSHPRIARQSKGEVA